MTQVDFYLLKPSAGSRHDFTCRLTDKAFGQGRRIYIYTDTQAEAAQLDRLLWTFRENSFIPHGVARLTDASLTPVLLGNEPPGAEQEDVLINLAAQVPAFFSRFSRVAEIISDEQDIKQAGRIRYKFYKDRGYPLKTHDMS